MSGCPAAGGRSPRILFCTQTAYVGGGVEEWLWSLARALGRHGWEVEVALAVGASHHRPEVFLARYPYVGAHLLRAPRGLREERFLAVRRLLASRRPDIVVPVQLADVLYAAARAKRNDPQAPRLAVCLHGQALDVLEDLKRCAGDLDLAASVSMRGTSLLASVGGIEADRVTHLPTGVPPAVAPRPIGSSSMLELGYVGRLDLGEKRINDLPLLVEALSGTANLRFHIAGSGPQEAALRERLSAQVQTGRVVFHGAMERERLYQEIYPRLDALLLFSEAEGGPIVAWEAMAHGVVPVVSDFLGRREEGVLVHEANALVFPVGDLAAAAECVRALTDPGRRARLSEEVRRLPAAYTLAGFEESWDRQLRAVLERPVRIGTEPLPPMISPGRLRVGRGERLTYALRVLAGRRFAHSGPGGEWPHAYGGRVGDQGGAGFLGG